jgi:hypothetical protein
MTPDQALAFLSEISGQLPATREMHQRIMQALQVLAAAIALKPVREEKPPVQSIAQN